MKQTITTYITERDFDTLRNKNEMSFEHDDIKIKLKYLKTNGGK